MSTAPPLPAAPASSHNWLKGLVACLHLSVILYVAGGWLSGSRFALLAYLLVLPLIALQWLFNGRDSLISSGEGLFRTGHWRDTRSRHWGNTNSTSITFAILSAMLVLWTIAFYRMVLIPTQF